MARSAVLLKPVLLLGCHVLHSWPHDRLELSRYDWTFTGTWNQCTGRHLPSTMHIANPRHHLFTVSFLARYDLVGVGRTPDDFVFPVRRRRQNEPLLIRPEHPLEPVFYMLQTKPAGLKPRCLVRGCQGWSQMGVVWSPTKISAKDFPDLSGSHLQLLRSLSDMGCRIFLEENCDLHFFICR